MYEAFSGIMLFKTIILSAKLQAGENTNASNWWQNKYNIVI